MFLMHIKETVASLKLLIEAIDNILGDNYKELISIVEYHQINPQISY